MNRKEMSELFSIMALAWPNAEMLKGGTQKLEPTISLWALCLKDIDFWLGQQAIIKLCNECKFPPSIAEVKAAAEEIARSIDSQIKTASIRLAGDLENQSAEEIFGELPDGAIKDSILAMGGPENLLIRDYRLYYDGRKEPCERYNYEGFYKAYKAVLMRDGITAARPQIKTGGYIK